MSELTDVPELAAGKLADWLDKFKFYRAPPTAEKVHQWLGHFDICDWPLAAKILDNVRVVSELEIHAGYKAALEGLPGWGPERTGRWFFVGFGKAGESGPAMVRLFREANNLAYAKFDNDFCTLSDLPALQLTAFDNVVFIDDFAGSGRQVCKMWPRIGELIASEATCYLVLTAITDQAQSEIDANTELNIVSSLKLERKDDVFSDENEVFTKPEKDLIAAYGADADPRNPRGYGDCGLLFVLSHKTPNNTIPILHVNEERWRGLFPRYLRAA